MIGLARETKASVDSWCYLFRSFKSVNSVPHERLLTKTDAYGIQGSLLSWLRCFLTNRYQRVVVQGHHSSWTSVLSGVPQGTVLGPILFLICINDISRNIMSNTKLFADDIKVYRVLRDTKEDEEELQKDLTCLESWSLPCEQLVSPGQNERETTASNRSPLWVNRRPAPGTNKLTLNWSN